MKALKTFENLDELNNSVRHEHRECTINLFARHQIWIAQASGAQSSENTTAKNRCWYIINPEIGMGKVLAAPISKSYLDGIPIDIGKNFLMYVHPELATALPPASLVRYLGVATREIQSIMENYLRFLYLGDREVLSELDVIHKQFSSQINNLIATKDDATSGHVAMMKFDSHGNARAQKFMKLVRNTKLGEQMDIRDFYLANIYANNSAFSKDGAPGTRRYYFSPDETQEDDHDTSVSEKTEKLSTPETQEDKTDSCSTAASMSANPAPKRIYSKNFNKEELRFIVNYKNKNIVRRCFGFNTVGAVNSLIHRIRVNPSIIDDKPSIDIYSYKKIYTKMQNSTISPFDTIRDFDKDEIEQLRTFVACAANGRYSGMNTIFGQKREIAISRISEELEKWYLSNR